MPLTVLIHGPAGSGKDTQVDLLKDQFDFEKIGTGDMFRSLADSNKDVRDSINKGDFVSSELTYQLLKDWVSTYDTKKNWFFVSVVRTPDQVDLLDELLKDYGRSLDLFLHLKISEEEAVERMSLRKTCETCGRVYHEKYNRERNYGICNDDGGSLFVREDDKPEAIKRRLEEYNRTIEPILEKYKTRGIFVEIDGSRSIQEIHGEIVDILKEKC